MKATRSIIVRISLVVCFVAALSSAPLPSVSLTSQPSRAPLAPIQSPVADCGLFPGQVESSEANGTVGLTERVDPTHAPRPSNESERLLFRQLYETLVRADCQGNAAPGLADTWRLDTSRNIWIVTLRANARFSDNTPVTSTQVVSNWMSAGVGAANGSELRPEVRRLVRAIVAVDDRTLEIDLQSRRADAVLALAHTDLAIAKFVPGTPWPLGTRTAEIVPSAEPTVFLSSYVITLRQSGDATTRFRVAPGRDGRDLLDQSVDLLLTRDPRTLDYAATLPQYQSASLPWLRTHVLISPGRARTATSLSAEERRALAQDAVRGPARGAEGPFWWESLSDCEGADTLPSSSPPAQAATARRIVYDADDSAARELAERFVGIGTYLRANGLAAEALAQALRRGNESAYILTLERHPLDPCREIQGLVNNAGWLDPQTFVPLVDTRLQAIVRRGRSGLTVEWDGALLLGGIRK